MAVYKHFYELPVYKACRNFRKEVSAIDDDGYISKEVVANLNKQYKVCLQELNGYIKYLKTVKTDTNNK